MTTAADELRTAAARLRTLIAAVAEDMAANPYWASAEHPPHAHPSLYARGVDNGLGGPAGALAAAMHPGVGNALADWLDTTATSLAASTHPEWQECVAADALAVARQINTGSQP
jgi:hypothetical protein